MIENELYIYQLRTDLFIECELITFWKQTDSLVYPPVLVTMPVIYWLIMALFSLHSLEVCSITDRGWQLTILITDPPDCMKNHQ